jgi:hypothetical protein
MHRARADETAWPHGVDSPGLASLVISTNPMRVPITPSTTLAGGRGTRTHSYDARSRPAGLRVATVTGLLAIRF